VGMIDRDLLREILSNWCHFRPSPVFDQLDLEPANNRRTAWGAPDPPRLSQPRPLVEGLHDYAFNCINMRPAP
ncbi:MAG: hypothetical protein ACREJP_09400, partial [Candidatus Methylomirabilales bacterium]